MSKQKIAIVFIGVIDKYDHARMRIAQRGQVCRARKNARAALVRLNGDRTKDIRRPFRPVLLG